jgi:hypothetical protein
MLKPKRTRLKLKIDPSGEMFYMETEDGQMLPNITELKIPSQFPHDYNNEGFPIVNVSFILQDVDIEVKDVWLTEDDDGGKY